MYRFIRLMELIIFISQIFFDDSPRNIASGKAAGLHTVIVSSESCLACTLIDKHGQTEYQ